MYNSSYFNTAEQLHTSWVWVQNRQEHQTTFSQLQCMLL